MQRPTARTPSEHVPHGREALEAVVGSVDEKSLLDALGSVAKLRVCASACLSFSCKAAGQSMGLNMRAKAQVWQGKLAAAHAHVAPSPAQPIEVPEFGCTLEIRYADDGDAATPDNLGPAANGASGPLHGRHAPQSRRLPEKRCSAWEAG